MGQQQLNLPEYQLKTKKEAGKTKVFDFIRKKWIVLTPEEWVRQSFIHYLVEECSYPASKIGVEVSVHINQKALRADAVVYDSYGDVVMLLEFKAPSVSITETVFSQIADYNTKIGAQYLLISNGMTHYCASVATKGISLMDSIPVYNEIIIPNTAK